MNLFWSTRVLTQQREDHLTEFLAAALEVDEGFREAYADILLGRLPEARGGSKPRIRNVVTQADFRETRCRPDLLLGLEDGRDILCEHKLEAAETLGSGEADDESTGQLVRYLALPADGVAFVRASWASIETDVLADTKYIRPESGDHFLWRDLYPALKAGSHEITHWLTGGFERLGFTPPLAAIGDLADPDEGTRLANQKNLGKLWDSTRSLASSLGWKVEAGHYCELYLKNSADSEAEMIYISPLAEAGGLLRFRVTPKPHASVPELRHRVEAIAATSPLPVDIEVKRVKRAEGPRDILDVQVPLRDLLGEEDDAQSLESRLRAYTGSFLQAVASREISDEA